MRNQNECPPSLGKLVEKGRIAKKEAPAPEWQSPDVVGYRLAVTEPEPEGYDPCDKLPPVITDAPLRDSTGRPARKKPGR